MRHRFAPLAFAAMVLIPVEARSAEDSLPRPMAGNPGNIFLEGEDVTVKLGAGDPAADWICIDSDGREIRRGSGAGAALGKIGIGYYEIWKLGANGSRKNRLTVAVLAPLKAATPEDSPIALDTAASWFYRNEKAAVGLREAASLVSLAGVNYVRDRLSWAETEPQRGKFAGETIYDRSAAAFSERGVKVLQVFHETPAWAGSEKKRIPDDLRDAYAYLKSMSARWKGKVTAWEPWNEGDTYNFGWQTGAELAAYQKAAYLAIRAGNPDALVCQAAFAENHRTGVLENFIENEVSASFDSFNFHHYLKIPSLPAAYSAMRPASDGKPVWVTEAYFQYQQPVKNGDLDLPAEVRGERSRFVTQDIATGLGCGADRLFTFLLPHYVEGHTLYGLLNEDGTPRPDYVALAAAGRLLAGAKPQGSVVAADVQALAFRAKPDGEDRLVVVAWSERKAAVPPSMRVPGKCYDYLGRALTEMPVKLGKNPVYFVYPTTTKMALGPGPAAIPKISRPAASPLVIQAVMPKERLRLNTSSWLIRPDETVGFPVRVYQFGATAGHVSIAVKADPFLEVTGSANSFQIESGDRAESIFKVRLKSNEVPARPLLLKFIAKMEGQPDSITVIRFSGSLDDVKPEKKSIICSAADSKRWAAQASPGKMELISSEKGVEISAAPTTKDAWVYPWLKLGSEERASGQWDGIAFTIQLKEGSGTCRAMLKETGGAVYVNDIAGPLEAGKPRRVVMLFRDFAWGVFSAADANHQLDTELIEGLSIGGNPTSPAFRYELQDLEWVRFVRN